MPLAICGDKHIFFAHVPKSGGSTVEDYLTRRFGPLSANDIHSRRRTPFRGLINSATHLTASDLREFIPQHVDLCFSFVRDPLKRIQSEYRWQAGASRASRLSFSTWLRIVLLAARTEPRLYDNHIRPQVELVPDQAVVFRLEDGFESMVHHIDQIVGQPETPIHLGHLKNTNQAKADIVLHRQDVALIRQFYAADYRRFDYPLPEPSDYPPDPTSWRRATTASILAPLLVIKQRVRWVDGLFPFGDNRDPALIKPETHTTTPPTNTHPATPKP